MKLLPSFTVLALPDKIQSQLSALKEEHLLFSNLIDYRLNPSDFLKNDEIPTILDFEAGNQNKARKNVIGNQQLNEEPIEKIDLKNAFSIDQSEKKDKNKEKSCYLMKMDDPNSQPKFFINHEEKIIIEEILDANSICSVSGKSSNLYYFFAMLLYLVLSLINLARIKKKAIILK